MAHPDLPVRFWVWSERGAYLGMPLVNLVGDGWAPVSAFMGLSRLLWRAPVPSASLPVRPPVCLYAVNIAFGAVLCASLGLWTPIVLGTVASVGPAALALRDLPGQD